MKIKKILLLYSHFYKKNHQDLKIFATEFENEKMQHSLNDYFEPSKEIPI